MKLSKSEEELMNHIWKLEAGYMKDILDVYPDPKPATTTVATLLKRITDKGFVGYTKEGKSRKYYPLIKKRDYFSRQVNHLIKNFFNDSAPQFASFFTQETDLSKEDLEKLKDIIDNEIKKK